MSVNLEISRDEERGKRVADRAIQIMKLLTGTQDSDPQIEYSALAGAAAMVACASIGMQPTEKNLSRILRVILRHDVFPLIRAELRIQKGGRR